MLDPIKNAFTVTGLRALIAKIKGSLAAKVDTTDVVTSWQDTPDDSHVPSEKLVKDTLDNLPPGTAVKGDAESEYRTGNVNLTPANIGAATSAQGTKADSAIQGVSVNSSPLTPDANKTVNVVVPTASTTTPAMDGSASAGSENHWAKGDHVHPTDTSREATVNKKQSINDSSTTDFPSSKAVADFVNSSVATSTANFLGSFDLTDLGLTYPATNVQIVAALNSHTWPAGVTVTNNDYVYVEIENTQTTGVDDRVERYKYSSVLASWGYEYTLNNSSFTAAEIAAIDSGITATDKSAYDAHLANTSNPHSVTKAQVGLGSVVNTGDSDTPISGGTTKFTTGGAFTELAKKADNTPTFTQASTRTNLSGNGETMPTILGKIKKWFDDLKSLAFKDNVTDSDISGSISDTHIASASTWNGKQDAISTDADSSTVSDATSIATGYGSNKVHLNTAARLWAYIQGKISSVLGLTSSSYGGKAASLNASAGGPSQPVYFPSNGADLGKPVPIPMSTDPEIVEVGDFLTIQAQGAYYAHKAGNAATADAVSWVNVSGKPNASSSVPISDGYVANAGVSTDYARADHIHADNIIVIPALTYTTLGVEVNNKVEYLNAWLKYVWANYQTGVLLQKEVVGVLIPGVNGVAHGQFYGGSGTSADGYPKHSFFTAFFWGGSHVMYYFGTENGTFYISNGNVDNLTSVSAEYALSANQGRVLNGLIAAKADDSSVVHLAGAETITGQKTFSGNIPQLSANSYKFQRWFLRGIPQPNYADWTSAQKDNNHFRKWTISFSLNLSKTYNLRIKATSVWSYKNGVGSLEQTQSFITNKQYGFATRYNSCTQAYGFTAYEFRISQIYSENNIYKVDIVSKYPESNNTVYLDVELSTMNDDSDLVEAPTISAMEIIEGWPSWAGHINDYARLQSNERNVMLAGDNAASATDATYATKIGSSSSHPAIGSATQPVYVDSNGAVQPCTLKGVYFSQYDADSLSNILDMFGSGMLVFSKYAGNVYLLISADSNGALFVCNTTVDGKHYYKTLTVDSSNVWTNTTENIFNNIIVRKHYGAAHEASVITTATDITNGYVEYALDFTDIYFGGGLSIMFVSLPNDSVLAYHFTRVDVMTYPYNTGYSGIDVCKFTDLSHDDNGNAVGANDEYTWIRTCNSPNSPHRIKGLKLRCYLNTSSGMQWDAGIELKLKIDFNAVRFDKL